MTLQVTAAGLSLGLSSPEERLRASHCPPERFFIVIHIPTVRYKAKTRVYKNANKLLVNLDQTDSSGRSAQHSPALNTIPTSVPETYLHLPTPPPPSHTRRVVLNDSGGQHFETPPGNANVSDRRIGD